MGMISPSPEQYSVMPDFARGTAGFVHTVDSAVHVLETLGIADSRLTLRMAGPGHPILQVVRQSPPPRTRLSSSVEVTLWISGFGFFEALPLPMRESGGEAEIGTRELCRLFDDPVQKAAQWLRAAGKARYFRVCAITSTRSGCLEPRRRAFEAAACATC